MAKKPKSPQAKAILAAMVWADTNMAQIAKLANKSVTYIKQIVEGDRTGYEVRPIIAKACNKRVEELWPDTPERYRRAA